MTAAALNAALAAIDAALRAGLPSEAARLGLAALSEVRLHLGEVASQPCEPLRRPLVGEPATERQRNALAAIARASLGWTYPALRRWLLQSFGVEPDRLSRAQASVAIDRLSGMAAEAGPGGAPEK